MFPQRRMTTDTPDGNYEQALNLFVRGEDGWVQMPSRSISLNAGECKGIKSATAYKIAEFAREQGYLE